MALPLERLSRADEFLDTSGLEKIGVEKYEAKIARFERLGIRLFGVANCLVSFGGLLARQQKNEHAMDVIEAGFCETLGFSAEISVFGDLTKNDQYATHPTVVGAPYIRFCAQHPIVNTAHQIVGCIYLIDYTSREFDDESRLLFADLAALVEREVLMSSMKLQYAEMQKQVRSLKRQALLDPVLGMWNRSAIVRSLGLELERCQKAEKPISLLFIGIDRYQEVKEKFGGTTSDAFLLRIVSRMRSCIRPFDALGRFEGDSFLVVLPGASNLVASAVAERMRLAVITHPETIEDQVIDASLFVGIASSSIFPNVSPELLITYAEKALLLARRSGNNRIVQAAPTQFDSTF